MNRLTHSSRRICPVCFGAFTQPGRFGYAYCSKECADVGKANRRPAGETTPVSRSSPTTPDVPPRGTDPRTFTAGMIGAGLGFIALAWILRTNAELAAAAVPAIVNGIEILPHHTRREVDAYFRTEDGRDWRLRLDVERLCKQMLSRATVRGQQTASTASGAVKLSQPKRGFTATELLIAVAIVALLLSLLLPTLAGAREQARRTRCGMQMRSAVEELTIDYERSGFPYVLPPAYTYRCPSDPGEPAADYGRLHRGQGSYDYHPDPGERVGHWTTLVLSDRRPWHEGGRNEARGDGAVSWRAHR